MSATNPEMSWNLNIFESSVEVLKGICPIQPVSGGGTIQWARQEALAPATVLKKAETFSYHKQPGSKFIFQHFLLVPLPHMNNIYYHYLHKKNYKAVNTFRQVFCFPASVNTKQTNPRVYWANFMQCICTGYCESWIPHSYSALFLKEKFSQERKILNSKNNKFEVCKFQRIKIV